MRVAVLLGVGERDITGPPRDVPASFPASRDIELCVLPGTGRSHFAFPTCERLFERIARWAGGLGVPGTRRVIHE